MKKILFLSFLCYSFISINAQHMSGIISSNDGVPLWGATILSMDNGVITDSLGRYTIQTGSGLQKIKIQYLGFEGIDTSFVIQSDTIINWQLTPSINPLKEVTITAQVDNIFDDFTPHIFDFIIEQNYLLILADNFKEKYILKAKLDGTILSKFLVEDDFYQIERSCLGGIILVGKKTCAELYLSQERTLRGSADHEILIQPFDRHIYETVVVPCVHKHGETLIFEHVKNHNKLIDYYHYDHNKKQKRIFRVFDKVGAKVSQSYFRDIIRIYYQETAAAGEDAIDLGFARDNAIKEGTWSGDVRDLIRENESHFIVGQYIAMATKLARSDIFSVGNKSYILNWVDQTINQLNNEGKSVQESSDLNEFNDAQIYSDLNNNSILVENKKRVYHIENYQNSLRFIPSARELERHFIIQRSILYNDKLYQLGRASLGSVQNEIFVQDID